MLKPTELSDYKEGGKNKDGKERAGKSIKKVVL